MGFRRKRGPNLTSRRYRVSLLAEELEHFLMRGVNLAKFAPAVGIHNQFISFHTLSHISLAVVDMDTPLEVLCISNASCSL